LRFAYTCQRGAESPAGGHEKFSVWPEKSCFAPPPVKLDGSHQSGSHAAARFPKTAFVQALLKPRLQAVIRSSTFARAALGGSTCQHSSEFHLLPSSSITTSSSSGPTPTVSTGRQRGITAHKPR